MESAELNRGPRDELRGILRFLRRLIRRVPDGWLALATGVALSAATLGILFQPERLNEVLVAFALTGIGLWGIFDRSNPYRRWVTAAGKAAALLLTVGCLAILTFW